MASWRGAVEPGKLGCLADSLRSNQYFRWTHLFITFLRRVQRCLLFAPPYPRGLIIQAIRLPGFGERLPEGTSVGIAILRSLLQTAQHDAFEIVWNLGAVLRRRRHGVARMGDQHVQDVVAFKWRSARQIAAVEDPGIDGGVHAAVLSFLSPPRARDAGPLLAASLACAAGSKSFRYLFQ